MENRLGIILGLTVGIVVIGSALVPIINSALVVVGDPVTYENTGGLIFKEIEDGDVLILERTITEDVKTDVVTLNGEPVAGTMPAVTENLIMSDGVYLRKGTTTGTTVCNALVIGETITPNQIISSTTAKIIVTFEDGVISATKSTAGSDPVEYFSASYTWGFVASPITNATHFVSEAGGNVTYVNEDSEIILCGLYESGQLDTLYTYYNGDMVVYNSLYTATLDMGLTLVSGTTDIYTSVPVVSVTDGSTTETFTPYRFLVPLIVNGHEDSGNGYSVLSVIPIVVIITLIVAAVSMVRFRN